MIVYAVLPFSYTCRYSSVVERALRKRTVVGSIPTGGFYCLPSESSFSFSHTNVQIGGKTKWNRRGLNPGPSACKADVIPLHHNPICGHERECSRFCLGI
jgi:hypothetical protein